MNKKYTFEIGIEGAPIQSFDDMFEAEIELNQEEHNQIINAYDEYMYSDDDLDQVFRDYLPELNEKLCKLAEPYAVAKWGDIAKLENGAWYEIFTPDEIEEEYLASDAYKAFQDAQERMQTKCKNQSTYEHNSLVDGARNGRWPHFKKAGQFGLFDCYRATGGTSAYYSKEGQCNGMHIDYCKRYKLRESHMEIEFRGQINDCSLIILSKTITCFLT